METEMVLNETERLLIELVRVLPTAQVQQVIALAAQLKGNPEQANTQLHEERVEYGLSVGPYEIASDDEVRAIIQRSFKEHDDVWAELAKR